LAGQGGDDGVAERAAEAVAEFFERLELLYIEVGEPPLRTVAGRSPRLSQANISELLNSGRRKSPPGYEVMTELVKALLYGLPPAEVDQALKSWHDLWTRTRAAQRRAQKAAAEQRRAAQSTATDIVADAHVQAGQDADAIVKAAQAAAEELVRQARLDADRIRLGARDEQAALPNTVSGLLVSLSRRSQSLVLRQLDLINELQKAAFDPHPFALTDKLDKLGHLANRLRRNDDSMLVLADKKPMRLWSPQMQIVKVLEAATYEVDHYNRVTLDKRVGASVVVNKADDLVHLVVELLENALSFSDPATRALVTANAAPEGGVMVEIEDSGIGMVPKRLAAANQRLANPPAVDVTMSRRMGLFVVGRLAARHGIQVHLRSSASGGITAAVKIPDTLLEIMPLFDDEFEE
jgi:signal transduction histidine kinase